MARLRARGSAARPDRRRARPRRRPRQPPRLARARRGGPRPEASRPVRSRPPARSRWPPTRSRGAGARGSTTSPTSRCCCWRPTCSTWSTCGRGGSRSCSPFCSPGSASGPGPTRRSSCSGSSSARSRSGPRSRCASGRCSATPARTWSERWQASRCWSRSAKPARWVALGLVAALTIYGEFRSISATIDRVPPLRWLDSIGRLRQGPPQR